MIKGIDVIQKLNCYVSVRVRIQIANYRFVIASIFNFLMHQRFFQLKRQSILELIAVFLILTERTCRGLDAHNHPKVVALIHCVTLLNRLIKIIAILLLQFEVRLQFLCNRVVIQIDGILRFPGSRRRHCAHFICRLHCDLIVIAAVAVVGLAHVVVVSLIHEDGAGDIGEGNGHFRDSALDGTRNNGQRIVAYRLHDADGLVVGSSVFIIGDHIAGDGFVSGLFALGEVGKAMASISARSASKPKRCGISVLGMPA